MTHSLFIFAGEPSGDILGKNLVQALHQTSDHFDICGVGGAQMQSARMKIIAPMERFEVMGFTGVLKALPRLFQEFRKIKKHILTMQPQAVILIDYPEFNMLLAKSLRKHGYRGKLVHYVCPSVWAWRTKRIYSLANTLDSLLSILPFEKQYFAKTSLPVTYVGHPLVDAIDNYTHDPSYPLPTDKPILAIFPGSRKEEIALNLPLQWAAARQLKEMTPVISVANPNLLDEIKKWIDAPVQFVPQERRYELMHKARLGLATSGTIVLEMGLHALPTVVTYQLATLNYLLGRYVFRIHLPFYTLVNIICEKEVFPEFIHKNLSSTEIANTLRNLNQAACKKGCEELRTRLLNQNASQRAAETIDELIR